MTQATPDANKNEKGVKADRTASFLLAVPEKKLLMAISKRLPAWVFPDLLTGVGLTASLLFVSCMALSTHSSLWLLAAVAMLFFNWFGDSLDGTLARVRKIERPRYGYYLDHAVDAISTTAFFMGLGFSPYMSMPIAAGGAIVYLTLSINVYLEAQAFGKFDIGYGKFGPTEARIFLALICLAMATGMSQDFDILDQSLSLLDIGGILMIIGGTIAFMTRVVSNLRKLAKEEPSARALQKEKH